MGEFNASNSLWKKANEWTCNDKSDTSDDSTLRTPSFNLQLDYNPYNDIKREHDEVYHNNQSYQNKDQVVDKMTIEPDMEMIQEVDPLDIPVQKTRRRRGSGPKAESPEERAARLAKMSAYAAQRLASETPEQRATRLKRMSQYAAKRLASETSEQRAKRLSRMSAYAAQRLARETPEQRQARLARMSSYAKKKRSVTVDNANTLSDEIKTETKPDSQDALSD